MMHVWRNPPYQLWLRIMLAYLASWGQTRTLVELDQMRLVANLQTRMN